MCNDDPYVLCKSGYTMNGTAENRDDYQEAARIQERAVELNLDSRRAHYL